MLVHGCHFQVLFEWPEHASTSVVIGVAEEPWECMLSPLQLLLVDKLSGFVVSLANIVNYGVCGPP